MKASLANASWVASCFPEWRRFQRASGSVQETQAGLLSRYLNLNQETVYGRKHRFSQIKSASQYQKNAPLTTYDDYTEYIQRIGDGESSVLTSEPVSMFELSSGSVAASKLIPYTRKLKSEFQCGIAPWIYNLFTHMPDLLHGSAYWSITPLVDGKRHTHAGIPIGFESDSAYLGRLGKWLVNSVMAVPDAVKYMSDINSFRYITLLSLLRHDNLRLISVWNPTFLKLLLAKLPDWWDSLLFDIERGVFSTHGVEIRFPPDPKLARRLWALSPTDFGAFWRNLRLISCWADGVSAMYARQVAEQFPSASLQGKGLIATEAFVSAPLVGVEGCVLAINSHYFEFIDPAGEIHLAHQIEKGKAYSVVITTGGGFYRYQLHDIVEVVGHWGQIPCICFVGKEDHISDWFGEKLDERFVSRVLDDVYFTHNISPVFSMLAPDNEDGFRYVLYLESECMAEGIAQDLDNALRENFHYDYCRKLGQLESARIVRVKSGAEAYLRACQARGQKMGNIKPSVLQKNTGWNIWFANASSIHAEANEEKKI